MFVLKRGVLMSLARRLVDVVVILGVAYLSFAMALAGWIAALRRGEGVTLLPARGGRKAGFWKEMGLVAACLAAFYLLARMLWLPLPIRVPSRLTPVLLGFGSFLFLAGTGLVIWARNTLGRMWGISTSREVKLLPDHRLITGGPYAFIRHPMYFGWWLAVFGVLLIYRTWLVALVFVFSLLVFHRRARLEERVLAERFGEEWRAYAERTRFLVPFVY